MNQLKQAVHEQVPSKAIVVSFDDKWRNPLDEKQVRCIFRKRAPRNWTPKYIYMYIGSPTSSLIERCEILSLEWLRVSEALALANTGHISEPELRSYAAGYENIAVYHIKTIQMFKRPLSYSFLKQRFSFSPPQSFFALSEVGQKQLDECGDIKGPR